MMRLAIIGGGSWGTALACVLAPRFDRVRLWVNEPDLAARMQTSRVNDVFLPGIAIPANVDVEHSLEASARGCGRRAQRDALARRARCLQPDAALADARGCGSSARAKDSKPGRCCACRR